MTVSMFITGYDEAKQCVLNGARPILVSIHDSRHGAIPWTDLCPDRLILEFDDIIRENPRWPQFKAVTPEQVQRLIEFARAHQSSSLADTWHVHCAAGVSRSVASALVVMAALHGDASAAMQQTVFALRVTAFEGLREPGELPNGRIVLLGDRLLGMNGELVRAALEQWPRMKEDIEIAKEDLP